MPDVLNSFFFFLINIKHFLMEFVIMLNKFGLSVWSFNTVIMLSNNFLRCLRT